MNNQDFNSKGKETENEMDKEKEILISFQNEDQKTLGFLTIQSQDDQMSLKEANSDGLDGPATVLLENPADVETIKQNSINKCLSQCIDECDMTYHDLPEKSKQCKMNSCLCDENDLTSSIANKENSDNFKTNNKFNFATAFMNFLVFLTVLFLTTSLIILFAILLKKNDGNKISNNADYEALESKQKITQKVFDEKLLDSQLFDSNYELMTTEDLEEDIVKITDI